MMSLRARILDFAYFLGTRALDCNLILLTFIINSPTKIFLVHMMKIVLLFHSVPHRIQEIPNVPHLNTEDH